MLGQSARWTTGIQCFLGAQSLINITGCFETLPKPAGLTGTHPARQNLITMFLWDYSKILTPTVNSQACVHNITCMLFKNMCVSCLTPSQVNRFRHVLYSYFTLRVMILAEQWMNTIHSVIRWSAKGFWWTDSWPKRHACYLCLIEYKCKLQSRNLKDNVGNNVASMLNRKERWHGKSID